MEKENNRNPQQNINFPQKERNIRLERYFESGANIGRVGMVLYHFFQIFVKKTRNVHKYMI